MAGFSLSSSTQPFNSSILESIFERYGRDKLSRLMVSSPGQVPASVRNDCVRVYTIFIPKSLTNDLLDPTSPTKN